MSVNPVSKPGTDHGFRDFPQIPTPNSLLASGAHDVYVIRDAGTGQLLHFGETGRGYLTRFAEHQRSFANQGLDIEVNLLRTVEGKVAAKALELRYIQTYTKTFGQRPPFNPVNH